jgi:hypothetical protein
MDDKQLQIAMQTQLLKQFDNDVNRTKKFVSDMKALGLDLGDPTTIKAVSKKTPVFMNLLTYELWGVLSSFARVIKELKKDDT